MQLIEKRFSLGRNRLYGLLCGEPSALFFLALVGILVMCLPSDAVVHDDGLKPIVTGYGSGLFEIGDLLYETDFEQPEDFVLQIAENIDTETKPRYSMKDGVLDIYVPERGCTAWLKRELSGPIAIVYQVRCPLETLGDDGIQARDINNFWHASDPTREKGVFDNEHYDGNFGSYHEMLGYYASSGGGGRVGNRTTRFRRYPRQIEAQDVDHLALNDRDGDPNYLITPGKWQTVQLVAFNGMVQYILDGKIVYQIREGDTVAVQSPQPDGVEMIDVTYTLENFPAYTKGYFGLRMVATHHQYKNLKIYRLDPESAE